jgi:hypothetical protein
VLLLLLLLLLCVRNYGRGTSQRMVLPIPSVVTCVVRQNEQARRGTILLHIGILATIERAEFTTE